MLDFNAKLGPWPYRPVKGIDDLLRGMDAWGIERAVVSSLAAVHFLNPQDGNDDLARAVAAHRDRLVPFAVIRPNFADWESDLARCFDDYAMEGVVLYPNYHRFALTDPSLDALATAMAERRAPLCIQAGLEDPRRQFDRAVVPEVPVAPMAAFALNHPEVTVVALGLKFGQPEAAGTPMPPNFHFDTSNYETTGDLAFAVETFGADRILLGTNFPLFNMQANIAKLEAADIPHPARHAIAAGNARRILA